MGAPTRGPQRQAPHVAGREYCFRDCRVAGTDAYSAAKVAGTVLALELSIVIPAFKEAAKIGEDLRGGSRVLERRKHARRDHRC